MKSLGRHILVEFISCSPEVLDDVSAIEKAMVEAAENAGATVISTSFHHFSPTGVSGVVVIEESHLAIHTWPEFGYAAVDLFTCGERVDPWISFDHLKNVFKAANHSALEMYRGSLSLLSRSEAFVSQERGRSEKHSARLRTLWFTDKDEYQGLSLRYQGDALFDQRSTHQSVRVFETSAYGRILALDGAIRCTERDEAHYHEMLVHMPLQNISSPKKVLIIGGGDGGAAREVLRYSSVERLTLVEIDELVVQASKKYFPSFARAFEDPRLELKICDGIEFVKSLTPESFDAIIVDAADPVGSGILFFEKAFIGDCCRVLRPGGVFATQGDSPMYNSKVFVELHKNLNESFSAAQARVALLYASTYPSGMWSVQWVQKGQESRFDVQAANSFSRSQSLKYYSGDLHQASMVLPVFVKDQLNGKT